MNFSQTIDDGYENLEDYNSTDKRNVLIVFVDMKADVQANNKKKKSYSRLIVLMTKETQYFTYFHITILVRNA